MSEDWNRSDHKRVRDVYDFMLSALGFALVGFFVSQATGYVSIGVGLGLFGWIRFESDTRRDG